MIGVIITQDTRSADPQHEYGERPVMVEKDADCPDCGSVHDMEACPKCGADIVLGFGLAFGGFGEYKFCEECDWHWLRPDWDAQHIDIE